MELTEEQLEMIRRNRERALEIRRRKIAEEEEQQKKKRSCPEGEKNLPMKCQKTTTNTTGKESCDKTETEKQSPPEDDTELEDFEMNAPPTVSKQEAMKMYCLPEGTLAVCQYTEKDNPRRKGWAPMKLYNRAEIRRRARERHGGLQGLVEERKKREMKRFRNDLEQTKNIFDKK